MEKKNQKEIIDIKLSININFELKKKSDLC